MMKKQLKLLALLCFTLTQLGCIIEDKSEAPAFRKQNIDKTFIKYVEKFINEGTDRRRNLSIAHLVVRFDNSLSGSGVLGTCTKDANYPDRYQIIDINPSFWNSRYIDNESRAYVFNHEMGHCLLDRPHDDSMISTVEGVQIPKTIMGTYFYSGALFANNYKTYMDELFRTATTLVFYNNSLSYDTFPYSYYNSISSTALTSAVKIYSSAIVTNNSDEPLSEMDYSDLSSFHCGEESHTH